MALHRTDTVFRSVRDDERAENSGRNEQRAVLPKCDRVEERAAQRVNRVQLYQGVQGMGREQQTLVS